jgi:hypothetical protein
VVVKVPETGGVSVELFRYELATRKLTKLLTIAPGDPVGMLGLRSGLTTSDAKHYVYAVHQRLDELYVIEGLR